MFSRLENFFKTADRRTEAIDTRMAIRRDEQREDERTPRKKKPPPSEEFSEDSLTVSIAGLIAFLQDLLPDTDTDMSETDANAPAPQRTAPHRQPANLQRAQAAAAYQTAQGGMTQDIPQHRSHKHSHLPDLPPEEQQDVKQLLTSLRKLAQKNVETLSIERSDNLLKSLRHAINTAQKHV